MSQSIFLRIPSDMLLDVLSNVDACDIRAFSAANKELMQRVSLLSMPVMQDEWLKKRTDAQLQKTLLSVAELYRYDMVAKLLEPRHRQRIGVAHLAIAFLRALRVRRELALLLLPFCQCSLKKASVPALKLTLQSPAHLKLASFQLQVYGERDRSAVFVHFNARMVSSCLPDEDSGTRNIMCVQWPLHMLNESHRITFWLGAPPPEEHNEWSPTNIVLSLDHPWLTVHCSDIPAVAPAVAAAVADIP